MSRTYETAIKIGATIAKAFKADTYNAAAALTKLTDATKKLKDAEKAAASYKKLDDAVNRSRGRYNQASEALRKLEAAEKAAGGATKESTQWRKAGERAVAKAAHEMDRATKAAEKNGAALRAMGVDTSKLSSEQERLARTLAATERKQKSLASYEHARERLFGKRKEHEPLFAKAGEQIKGVGETILHFAEGALVAGEGLHLLAERTIHAGANIGETAEKLGIGARALQELRYGARQSGAEVEDLDRALAKMAVTIGKHKTGKGKAGPLGIPGLQMLNTGDGGGGGAEADPFKRIGLSTKQLAGLKPDEQLKKIADGMAKLKTHSEKAAIAQAIFGKGAQNLLPYLSEGSAGIEKLSKSADKFGGVMTDESVAAAIAAEKASKDMKLAIEGTTNTIGSALLPTMTSAFKSISQWALENRGQIKEWAENIAKWIETKGIPAIKMIASEVKSFGSKVLWLVNGAAKLTGGFGNLAIAVGALRLAPLATTLGKIGIEGFKAAAAIFRYAAASRAAAAAGGAPGVGGGAGGLGGAGAALGIGAVVLGAGLYGINKFSEAGEARNQALEDAGVDVNKNQLEMKNRNKLARIARLEAGGMTHGQAVYAAEHPGTALPRTGDAGGGVHVAPVVHIHDARSRHHVAKGMDHAKKEALEAYDRRAAHHRRVAYE